MSAAKAKAGLWRRLRESLPQQFEKPGDAASELNEARPRPHAGGKEEEGPHSPTPHPDRERKKEPPKPPQPEPAPDHAPERPRPEFDRPAPAPDRDAPGLPEDEREHELPPMSPEPERRKAEQGWFARLSEGLSRSQASLTESIAGVFTKRKLDAGSLEELEEILLRADFGPQTAMGVVEKLAQGRYEKGLSPEEVRRTLAEEIAAVLAPVAQPFAPDFSAKPHVALIVGVNGSGKTTTIGKLAKTCAEQGRAVTIAAGDTFRAAAIEQLGVWAERTGAAFVAHKAGSDPAGVAFDAFERARAQGADLLMIDTAGRLQNRADLMSGLSKIVRVLRKQDPRAPHSVILVLDATTGQNALAQVEAFKETAGVTGVIVTKLDGSARGGVLAAIAERFGLPVHAIGIGEGASDLRAFDARDFANAIVGFGRPGA